MVAVLLFTATFAIAGPGDLVVTTTEREARLCIHEDASLKVFVTDTTGELTTFSYQWYYNTNLVGLVDPSWTQITGETTSILNLSNVSAATTVGNAGYYFCRIYYDETDHTVYRNSEKIHVSVATEIPHIGYVTAANVVCEGAAFDMEAFEVTGQLTKVWYFGEEVVARGNAYHVASASLENAGEYRFVASNACGDSVYGPFEIAVTELPRIVTQPRSAALCGGDDLIFRVVATGTDLQYQWYYNNAPYPSVNTTATTSILVIEDAEHDPEFYSNTFNVQVSNACATVTSRSVGSIVSEIPTIVGHLEPAALCAGETVTLSSDATTDYPTDTLTYQWFLDGRPVEGENANIITFDMDSTHMGEYYCEVTNGCGTVPSERAYIMVKMPPTVETQPQDVSVCAGEEGRLFTKITGIEPISYTWLNSNGDGLDFTDITTSNTTGVHTNTLIANPASDAHERYYYCYATNECGSVRTDTVYMTVTYVLDVYPNLYEPPYSPFSFCTGIDTVITVADKLYEGTTLIDPDDIEGLGITFAWHKVGETEIVSTEPELRFVNVSEDDEGQYVCDITNACGLHTENPFMVNVLSSPQIVTQPQDIDVCEGGSLDVTVSATGDNLTYSWYRGNGDEYQYLGEGNVTNQGSTYHAPTVAVAYGGTYYCAVRSGAGCETMYSDTVMVTVGTMPRITQQPRPAVMAMCEGEAYGLGIRATGEGIHYQWYNNATALAGQTSDSLHISAVTRNNNGIFYCIVSNACDDVRTDNATLTVNNAPDMTLGPDIHACRGEAVVLAPQGQDEYGHYSWNYGTYGYQPTLTVTLGGSYILEVSDSAHGNCVARDTIFVTYHDYFDFSNANFDSTPIVTCGEFVLDAGAGAAEYMWSTTDMTNSITVGMNGYYMVTVDGDGYGCTTSAGVEVTIGEELVINLGDDITAPVDSEVEIGVPAVFDSYIWNTGFTGPKLTVNGEDYGIGNHTFWVMVTSGGCEAKDTITINFIEGGYVDMESMPVLNIYPNPASDYVNIVSENAEISEVQVYDMVGRLVVSRQVADESLTLNVAGMVDATYFVRVIYTDGKASVSKLIINR
ncbi:MAG: T9SS type A sorting domain-containing protein [Bacteroidales bacterium]|nr:T9SS type A sorting domain-containing protein [Bacteroidales bacterium]